MALPNAVAMRSAKRSPNSEPGCPRGDGLDQPRGERRGDPLGHFRVGHTPKRHTTLPARGQSSPILFLAGPRPCPRPAPQPCPWHLSYAGPRLTHGICRAYEHGIPEPRGCEALSIGHVPWRSYGGEAERR